MSLNNGVDKLTLSNWFASASNQVEQLRFADNTLWSAADLMAHTTPAAGTTGNDVLYGGESGDSAAGLAGNDTLYGYGGNDMLDGGAGNDNLYGSDGNDTLDGGADNDALAGGLGNDTYLFGNGSGQDTLIDSEGLNTIQLAAGIVPANVTLTRDQYVLYVSLNNGVDKLTMSNWFASASNQVEQLRFADNTLWSAADLMARVVPIPGTVGNDFIYGSESGDNLTGLVGNDTLYGCGGNDMLDGGADNDSLLGDDGSDSLQGDAGNDTLYGGAGNDTLDGGAGDDVLNGGYGDDTYLFGRGSGHDTVYEEYCDGGSPFTDVLKLGAGITPGDVTLAWDATGSALLLSLSGGTDTLTLMPDSVWKHGNPPAPLTPFEWIEFADGTRVQMIDTFLGTANDDNLFFSSSAGNGNSAPINVQLDGGLGNDTLRGSAGKDLLHGGAGNDTIYGDHVDLYGASTTHSDDTIYGDAGDDTLYGGGSAYQSPASNDLLDGGAGNDTLYWASTVRYGRNYGQDRVIGGAKTIELFDLLPTDIDLEYQADGMAFKVKGSSDWLKVEGPTGRINVDRVNFSNGSFWDVGALEALGGSRANRPPQLNISFPEIAAVQGQAFSYVIPENAFIDPDGDALIWSVQGRPWESYNPVTRTLSGTPGNAEVGRQTVEVRVTDTAGASTSQAITIAVANINDAPSTGAPIPALVLKDGFAVDQPLPADAFTNTSTSAMY